MVSKAFLKSRRKLITFSFLFSHLFNHFSNCVDSAMFLPETVLFVMVKFNFFEVQVNSGVHDSRKFCPIQWVVLSAGSYLHLIRPLLMNWNHFCFFYRESGKTPTSRDRLIRVVRYSTVTLLVNLTRTLSNSSSTDENFSSRQAITDLISAQLVFYRNILCRTDSGRTGFISGKFFATVFAMLVKCSLVSFAIFFWVGSANWSWHVFGTGIWPPFAFWPFISSTSLYVVLGSSEHF